MFVLLNLNSLKFLFNYADSHFKLMCLLLKFLPSWSEKIKTGFIDFTLIKFTIYNEACKTIGKKTT